MKKLSLDELDRQSFHAGPSPLDEMGKRIVLEAGSGSAPENREFSLNGSWDFLEQEEDPGKDGWEASFSGHVPCGVHMALWKAGRIPNPMVGRNQEIAREHSFHTWWLRRTFSFEPKEGKRYRLCFEGVADRCSVWLNGRKIAEHQGMFGGPDVEVTDVLRAENELVVKLEPIPFEHAGGLIPHSNKSWRDTVVINNVYGWHYFNMPSLGVWRPVKLVELPTVELERPFVFTRDLEKGEAGMLLEVFSYQAAEATVDITIAPHNFQGQALTYRETVSLREGSQSLRYEFALPDPHLWWPNDLGDPDFYDVTVSCSAEGSTSTRKCAFGLRTIRMDPLPQGPDEETYNWAFVINGKKIFLKGTNWCTMDAMLDLGRERYNRFLTLAKQQHIQLLRAWGCGLPETDDFYELCCEKGIMVMQEWPTAWNSHDQQPRPVLEDTVRRHTLRLRSYPALAMYCAGNESWEPFGDAIDMMGRLSIELDGTRPYHRGEGWGGSLHTYHSYWDDYHLDYHLTVEAPFWGEFGFACAPSYETFLKYMPKESLELFPLEENPDFVIHTPTFGFQDDINHITQSAGYFLPKGYTWKQFITASQLTQALGVRRTLERSRARDPQCAGAIYYKMNDNSPAFSWSSVDYYGVPKISHYVLQDTFEPLHACVLFDRTSYQGIKAMLPVYLLDDAGKLPESGWNVTVRAYNGDLRLVAEKDFDHREPGEGHSFLVGRFDLSKEQTDSTPLFVVCDLTVDGALVSRGFYFSNFEQQKGCIFQLPRAAVRLTVKDSAALTVSNVGKIPAVGVMLTSFGKNDTAVFSDNFLWLEPGESKEIVVSGVDAETVGIEGLNLL